MSGSSLRCSARHAISAKPPRFTNSFSERRPLLRERPRVRRLVEELEACGVAVGPVLETRRPRVHLRLRDLLRVAHEGCEQARFVAAALPELASQAHGPRRLLSQVLSWAIGTPSTRSLVTMPKRARPSAWCCVPFSSNQARISWRFIGIDKGGRRIRFTSSEPSFLASRCWRSASMPWRPQSLSWLAWPGRREQRPFRIPPVISFFDMLSIPFVEFVTNQDMGISRSVAVSPRRRNGRPERIKRT